MKHDWKQTGATVEDEECAACGLARSRWFYLKLPNREPNQVFSRENHPEPSCEDVVIERVMRS